MDLEQIIQTCKFLCYVLIFFPVFITIYTLGKIIVNYFKNKELDFNLIFNFLICLVFLVCYGIYTLIISRITNSIIEFYVFTSAGGFSSSYYMGEICNDNQNLKRELPYNILSLISCIIIALIIKYIPIFFYSLG